MSAPENTPANTIVAIAADVAAGRRSARAVIEQTLARIADRDGVLNCFRVVLAREALAQAERIDADRAAGKPLGRLAGVPFGAKDLFDVAGRVTLAGAKAREGEAPATRDAAVVAALKAQGAILVGLLNMDEFAYGFSTENEHFGVTRNPHDPTRIAGGSSGGSAAAVAGGLVPLTLGSDTNGSVRVPAALCGVHGIKPTYNRLSLDGVTPFVASLDHVGFFAANMADMDLAWQVLADAPGSVDDAPLRVGVLQGWFRENAMPEALAAVDALAQACGNAQAADLPEVARARSAAFCITAAEAGALHLDGLRRHAALYDVATRDRLIAGAMLPAQVLVQSQRFRRWFRDEARALFTRFDVLLAPATPCAAPQIGQKDVTIDGKAIPVRANLGIYTQPISFIGLPVVVVPVAREGAMPLGVQLIGPAGGEARLIALAARLEQQGWGRVPLAGEIAA